jgi:hypothetical protein
MQQKKVKQQGLQLLHLLLLCPLQQLLLQLLLAQHLRHLLHLSQQLQHQVQLRSRGRLS